jgi:ABC-2 type transport system permease protein
MSLDVARLDLRLRRRATLGYALGIAAYTFVIVALYPAMRHDTGLDDLTKNNSTMAALFGAVGSITSPVGWLNANLFVNFAPLLVLLVTVGYGASCIAGQNDDDTLALVAVLPMTRRRIVLQKVVALCAQATAVSVVTGLVVLVGRSFELAVPLGHLAGATVGMLLLGIDLGLLALAIGSATGSRGLALGITSAIAVVSYVVSAMAPVISWMQPLRPASIFAWSVGRNQLATGLSGTSWVVLLGVGAALAAVSVWSFERLDIR